MPVCVRQNQKRVADSLDLSYRCLHDKTSGVCSGLSYLLSPQVLLLSIDLNYLRACLSVLCPEILC